MSEEKEHINNLRFKGLINGNRPFICMFGKETSFFLKKSIKYIVSYKDNTIYFQSLSYFKEEPNNKHDFAINIKNIINYNYYANKNFIAFNLRLIKGSIHLIIEQNNKKRVFSQIEFNDFVKYLNSKGVKDEENR